MLYKKIRYLLIIFPVLFIYLGVSTFDYFYFGIAFLTLVASLLVIFAEKLDLLKLQFPSKSASSKKSNRSTNNLSNKFQKFWYLPIVVYVLVLLGWIGFLSYISIFLLPDNSNSTIWMSYLLAFKDYASKYLLVSFVLPIFVFSLLLGLSVFLVIAKSLSRNFLSHLSKLYYCQY